MIKFVFSIFLVVYLSGCSTLVTHVGYTVGEAVDGEEVVFSRVYCGTKFNWSFQDTGHQGGNFFGLFLLPDLILSTAADTLLLPFTWTHDAIRTPTSDGIMDY